MTKRFWTVATMAGAGLAALAAPAQAQEQAGDKVIQRYVYGDDACEASVDPTEIVVCVRMGEEERYRIPEPLRTDPNAPENQAWTERVRSVERVGAFGTESCSPAGAGGFTGCTQEMIRQAYAERAANGDVQAGRLIEEARAERLSRIDEEAAAVEQRELEIERQLDQRAAEREAAKRRMQAIADGRDPDAPKEGGPDGELPAPPQ